MNVPKLRFEEFSKEWNIRLINDITSKVGSGSTPSGGSQVYTDKGILFIRSQNINNDQLIFDDVTYIPQSTHDRMKGSIVQANDILLNITGASIGRSCVVPEDFIEGNVNQHVSIIRLIDGYVPRFYQKYLSSERGQKHISSLQVGSGREGLNFQAIRKIAIPSPEVNEQQKIADFLSAVDDKITALTAQKTALTQYKQGMMQRIFSQTLRFKDDNGADYPEWETITLEAIATFYRGGQLSKSDLNEYGGYPCIHYGELFTSYGEVIRIVKSKTNINDGFESEIGDILMPSSDVTPNGLARASCILQAGVVIGGDINIVRIGANYNQTFLSYFLNFEKSQIIALVSGTTVKHIYIKDLKNIVLTTPRSFEEQTKIAQFLTELDDKINAVDAQIQSAQQWKQGLLQQMFV